jgi:hypothetical protein
MADGGWVLAVGPHNVGPQVEVFDARDRKLTYRVDDSADFSFILDGNDPVWQYITELITDVWLYRDNQVFYRGRVGPTADNIDEESNTVSINTFDYREWLGRQVLGPGARISWDQKPRSVIIQDILNYLNTQPGIKPHFVLDSSRLSTTLNDFDILVGTTVKDALAAMTGFGWQAIPTYATPSSPGDVIIRAVSPFYYVLNDYFVMEYGGVVSSLTRQLDTGNFANTVFVSGDMNLPPLVRNSSGLATDPRGPLGVVVSDPSIITTGGLSSRANQEITSRDTVMADWKCQLVDGGWINDKDAWLGDIVRFVVNSGRVNINDMYRITDFELALSDDGMGQKVGMTMVRPPYVPTTNTDNRTLEEFRFGTKP